MVGPPRPVTLSPQSPSLHTSPSTANAQRPNLFRESRRPRRRTSRPMVDLLATGDRFPSRLGPIPCRVLQARDQLPPDLWPSDGLQQHERWPPKMPDERSDVRGAKGEWLPSVRRSIRSSRGEALAVQGFTGTPGGTRIPNLLIRRWTQVVHRSPQRSITSGTKRFAVRSRP